VDDSTLLPAPMRPQDLVNRHRVVTSRAAENLFWLGRYTERAEHGARLMRIAVRALSGDDDLGPAVRDMLDQWCRQSGLVAPEAPALSDNPQAFERCLVRGLVPGAHAGGLVQSLQALGHAAAQVRERLGGDHRQWIASATALELLPAQPRREDLQTPQAMRGLEQLTEVLSAITGAQTDRMTRDDGWRLLSIGRHIERLTLLGEALSLAFQTGAVHSDSGFNLLLALFDSTITYRALYQKRLEVPPLLDLLMLDRENPRALGWVAQTLRARMAKLPDTWGGLADASPPAEPRAAQTDVLSADKKALLALAPNPDDWHLPELCTHTQEQHYTWLELTLTQSIDSAWRLSDEISRRYFAHASAPDRTLGGY